MIRQAIKFQTFKPPAELSGVIHELWCMEDDGRNAVGLPKPYIELVISLSGVHWWRSQVASKEICYKTGWITPIQTAPRYARATGPRQLLGARIYPWSAQAIFGKLPIGDGSPPLEISSVVDKPMSHLRNKLRKASSPEVQANILAQWIGELGRCESNTGSKLSQQSYTSRTVVGLAKKLRMPPRQIRRWFAREAALNPKLWLRLKRLDSLLRDQVWFDQNVSLAQIAYHHEYADQAHLNRDLRELVKSTPLQLRKGRSDHHPPHYLPMK